MMTYLISFLPVFLSLLSSSPPLSLPFPKAMDADGDLTPLTFEIAAGNELNHFELNAQAQP